MKHHDASLATFHQAIFRQHGLGCLETLDHPVAVLQLEPLGWLLQTSRFQQLWQPLVGQEEPMANQLALATRALSFTLDNGDTLMATPMGDAYPETWLLEYRQLNRPVAESSLAPAPLAMMDSSRLLQEITQAVNSSLILDEIFEALGDVLKRYIPYDEATILLLDDTQNGVKLLVNLDADGFADLRSEAHPFTGNDPCLSGLLINPVALRLPLMQANESLLSVGFDSGALIVPLVNKGTVIGAMSLNRHLDHALGPFNDQDEALLQLVADPVALAVENAKFYLRVQSQAGREFLINRLTMAIRQSLQIDHILSTAVDELGQVMGVSRCLIQAYATPVPLTNPWQSQPPSAVQSYAYQLPGLPGPDATYWPSRQQVAPLEWSVFQLRQPRPDAPDALNPFVLDDVADCPASLDLAEVLASNQVASIAIFPILAAQELVGTITLHQCDQVRAWLPEDLELFATLAEHLGVALSQAQLVRQLEAQNQQLEATLSELQQAQMQLIQTEKMAMLGQFVAGIAHEVNTPLGSIVSNNATLLSCVERLLSEVPDWIAHQMNGPLPVSLQAKRLDAMMQLLRLNRLASARIDETVKNLRNFARLDESERKVVSLHEGLESTLLLLRGTLPRSLRLTKRYQPDLPQLTCFPGLLNQVFMNLMVNAIHATQERPTPELLIETRQTTVDGKPWLEVLIADNGSGIAPEHLGRIFDPGFTTKGRGVGTGLGLALCYQIVEKHGGRILVDSEVGIGTTFTIQLPLQ